MHSISIAVALGEHKCLQEMIPYSAFEELVQSMQRHYQPTIAEREWERMDRALRDAERIDRMTREMDRIARITRETIRASEETMRRVYSQPFVDSLFRNEELLTRFTARAAERQALLARVSDGVLRQAEFARTIESFTERVIRETALQAGLVRRLMSGYRAVPSDSLTTNYDDLLNVVMRGFEETGLTQSEINSQTILWRFDAWLDKLPPNIRNFVISLIAGLLVLVLQEALNFYKSGLKALPAPQENNASLVEPEHEDVNFDMCR